MYKEFLKADLRDGMIVKTREGTCYLYLSTFDSFVNYKDHIELSEYTDDLINLNKDNVNDIMSVYTSDYLDNFKLEQVTKVGGGANSALVWERDEKTVEMTLSEVKDLLGIKNLVIIDEKESLKKGD